MTPYHLGLGLAWAFRLAGDTWRQPAARLDEPASVVHYVGYVVAAIVILPLIWLVGTAGMLVAPHEVHYHLRYGTDD